MTHFPCKSVIIVLVIVLSALGSGDFLHAASSVEIDSKVDATLKMFHWKVKGGKELEKKAKGVLVFPSVIKAGFWIGGEFGEGALRVNGQTIDYYNVAGVSFGLQFGVQSKSVLLLFMTKEAFADFRNSAGWRAGVDGAVALATLGAGGALNTQTLTRPIIGFVFGNKGLMVDVSLTGSKITKIRK
jgi:lipid-binding SYLF domain-containing protein